MKVLGICGSARKDGNTRILLGLVLGEMADQGIETEVLQLYDKDIAPCRGCFACRGKRQCVNRKDSFNEVFQKMVEANGIVLGSPVYSADISSKMKAFIERAGVVVASNPGMLRFKVAAAVAAERRGGGLHVVDTLNHFFLNKEMIVVGSTYWNMVYGKDIGDVLHDEEGIRNMKNLGSNMAEVLRLLCKEKQDEPNV